MSGYICVTDSVASRYNGMCWGRHLLQFQRPFLGELDGGRAVCLAVGYGPACAAGTGAGLTLGSQLSVPICEKHDRRGNHLTAEILLFKHWTLLLFFFFLNKVCIYFIWTSSSHNSHLSSEGKMSYQFFSGLSILPPVLNLMHKWKHINLCDILA